MKLLVNLSMLGARPTGLGVYASHSGHAALRMFDAELLASRLYSGPEPVAIHSPAEIALGGGRSAAVRRWLWSKRFRHGDAPRLVYSPTHHGLPGARHEIITVHDLIPLRYARANPLQGLYFRQLLPRRLKECRAVFTVSNATRQDLQEQYGFPPDRVHVVPNGVDTSRFTPPAEGVARRDVLLAVGASLPHKNLHEVLHRHALWAGRYRLVIVGSPGKYRRHMTEVVAQHGLERKVEFMDYVSAERLLELYQTSAALVYPSTVEGFGIPPLEALACGTPIIASDIPVHREVLGESAIFVKLGDAASWAGAFDELARTPPGLDARRRAPLDKYTWTRSAQALREALIAVEPRLLSRLES